VEKQSEIRGVPLGLNSGLPTYQHPKAGVSGCWSSLSVGHYC